MAKIGSYEYPETQFGTLLRAIETLVTKFPNGESQNEKNFAGAIGHKNVRSGGYLRKVADLRRYKLIEKSGIKATEIAKLIVKPLQKEERDKAINEAIMNVGLWEEIYKKAGRDVPSIEDFKIILAEITGDRDKSLESGDTIRNLYIDVVKRYNEGASKETKSKGSKKDILGYKQETEIPENMINARSGKVYIEMPKDKRYLKVVENLLSNLKLQLDLEEETPKDKK